MSGLEQARLRAVLLPRANYTAKLEPEQTRFLALHAHRDVWKWQWHWGSTLLRASTERGEHATISAPLFDDLVRAGLLKRSGAAGATITAKGRAATN